MQPRPHVHLERLIALSGILILLGGLLASPAAAEPREKNRYLAAYGADRPSSPGVESRMRPKATERTHAAASRSSEWPRGSTSPVPGAGGLAVDPETHTLYVGGLDDATLHVIDARSCNARRLDCRAPLATISLPQAAEGVAVDPRTHTVYAALPDAGTVAVIDGRRCNAQVTSGCSASPAAVAVGGVPIGVAINTRTRTVYVGNAESFVSVIDARTCNGTNTAGCATPPATIASGPEPVFPYVDDATSTLYVPNAGPAEDGGSSVSVVDISSCRAGETSGCGQTPTRLAAGAGSTFAEIDPVTDTLYIVNTGDARISVFDRNTCNARNTSGCGITDAPTIQTAPAPQLPAVWARTRTLYILSFFSDVVEAVDISTCNARNVTGCDVRPRTLRTGSLAYWLILDRSTDSLYVTNRMDGTLQVLDARGCNAERATECRREAPVANTGGAFGIGLDVRRHTLYESNPGQGTLVLVDTEQCNARRLHGCREPAAVLPVGEVPGPIAVDSATHSLYLGDVGRNVVDVIDTRTCNADRQDGCAPVATVAVDLVDGLGVNSRTHTVYVTQTEENAVAVIRNCTAADRSGCDDAPLVVDTGGGTSFPLVDETTNTVYLPLPFDNQVKLLPGAACDAGTPGCAVIATTDVGSSPSGMDVDPATGTLYVANSGFGDVMGTVSMVDTRTCSARNTTGCGSTWPTIDTVRWSFGLTVDQQTHTVYNSAFTAQVALFDGSRCNAQTQAGCPEHPRKIAVGYVAAATVIDPSQRTAYVLNSWDANLSLINTRYPCRSGLCYR